MMSNHNAIVNSPMDLGTTMAVFIVVAVVLMALFCLLLKCFSYQLSKRLKKAAHLYTDSHDLDSPHADGWEGEYD